jgi:predicted nucleotidyltransferase
MNKELLDYETNMDTRIEKFKAILEGDEHEEVIVQKYIVHGIPYVFKDNEDKYFDLKREIAANFSEHYNNIHMVGSAKLGFSIAPSKLWKTFDIESDIDIVIVSSKLFEDLWKSTHQFNIDLTSRNEQEERNYRRFIDYFFKGWIRPDLFPFEYPTKTNWFNFFKSISYEKYGPQKITGALYHSFNFFEKYHIKNISKLRIAGR